jgi:hypothetical protein
MSTILELAGLFLSFLGLGWAYGTITMQYKRLLIAVVD